MAAATVMDWEAGAVEVRVVAADWVRVSAASEEEARREE